MKNKWIREEYDKKFSNSEFWLNPKNYPRNYNTILTFVKYVAKKIEAIKDKEWEEDYAKFTKEMKQ